MSHDFDDIPLPPSDFGAELYRRGRRLVAEGLVRMDEVIWDCDEVLWDWLMDVGQMVGRWPRALLEADMGHREWVAVKPGVFEFIWGMHHAALAAGQDAHLRLWTNGYPWRLWAIGRQIPGFFELLGPPASHEAEEHVAFIEHPRIFSRGDFAKAAAELVDVALRRETLREFAEHIGELVDEQFTRAPYDSSFKLPELAEIVGKPGFHNARYLVDDNGRNIKRFIASRRFGVRVISHAPGLFGGRVPNTVWREAADRVVGLSNAVALDIAHAIEELACGGQPPASRNVTSHVFPHGYPLLTFEIDVPDRMLRGEWINPIRELKARAQVV